MEFELDLDITLQTEKKSVTMQRIITLPFMPSDTRSKLIRPPLSLHEHQFDLYNVSFDILSNRFIANTIIELEEKNLDETTQILAAAGWKYKYFEKETEE